MKQTVFILFMLLYLCGCNARNAELKRWDANGQLREQIRTGQVNFLAVYDQRNGEMYYDPNGLFIVSADRIVSYPDPNSIKATGNSVGQIGSGIIEGAIK